MPATRQPRRPAGRTGSIRPKRNYAAQLTQPGLRTRRRIQGHTVIGIVLLVLAAGLIPTHLAEHAGVLRLMPRNLEDLLIGFPMAGILLMAGFIALIWR